MKRILVIVFILAACNNGKEDTPADPATNDPLKNTDTRTVNPSDTVQHMDTGSYQQLSDSLRKQ